MKVIDVRDLDVNAKRVLIREDLNVPVKNGMVTSDARIRAAIPSIEYLLEAGAKVNVKVKRKDMVYTPLSIATIEGHSEVVKLLREHGAK